MDKNMKLKQSQRQVGRDNEANFSQRQIRSAREIIKKNFKTYEEVIFNMVLAMEKVYPINPNLRPTVEESCLKPLMTSSPAELTQLLLVHEAKCKAVIYKYSQDSYLCSTTESNIELEPQSDMVAPIGSASINQTANLEDKSVAGVSTASSPSTVAMDCNRERKNSGVCGTQLQNLQQRSPQQLQQSHKQLQQQYQSYEQIPPPQQQYQPQQQRYHPQQQQQHLPHQQMRQPEQHQQSKQPQQIHQQQQQFQEPQCQLQPQQTQELQIQEELYKLQQYERKLKSNQPQQHQSQETQRKQQIQEVQRKQRIYQMAMKVLQQQKQLKQQQQQQNIYRQQQQQQNIYEQQQKRHPMQCQQEQYQQQQQYQQCQEKNQYMPFKQQQQQQQQQPQTSIQSWSGSCAVEDNSNKEKYGNSRNMQTVANVNHYLQRKSKDSEPPSVLPETYSQGNMTDAEYSWQRKLWDNGPPLLLPETCGQSNKKSPLKVVPSSSSSSSSSSHHSAMYVERTNSSELNNAAVPSNLRNEDSTMTKSTLLQPNRLDAPEVFKNFSKHPTKLHMSPDDSQFNTLYPYCILNSLHSKPRDMPERNNYPHLYTLLLNNKSQATKENVVDTLSTSTTDLSGKKRKMEN